MKLSKGTLKTIIKEVIEEGNSYSNLTDEVFDGQWEDLSAEDQKIINDKAERLYNQLTDKQQEAYDNLVDHRNNKGEYTDSTLGSILHNHYGIYMELVKAIDEEVGVNEEALTLVAGGGDKDKMEGIISAWHAGDKEITDKLNPELSRKRQFILDKIEDWEGGDFGKNADMAIELLGDKVKDIDFKIDKIVYNMSDDELNAFYTIEESKVIEEGQFSWFTQDTNEQIGSVEPEDGLPGNIITVIMSDNEGRTWTEQKYEGYGEFKGKDYYELLAQMNGFTEDNSDKPLRDMGIDLAYNDLVPRDGSELLYPALTKQDINKDTWDFTEEPETDPNQSWLQAEDEDEDDDDFWGNNDEDEDEEW